jgi:hypothetical protein
MAENLGYKAAGRGFKINGRVERRWLNRNLKWGGSATAWAVREPQLVFEPGVAGVPSLVAPRKSTGEEGVKVDNPRVGR